MSAILRKARHKRYLGRTSRMKQKRRSDKKRRVLGKALRPSGRKSGRGSRKTSRR